MQIQVPRGALWDVELRVYNRAEARVRGDVERVKGIAGGGVAEVVQRGLRGEAIRDCLS